VTVRERVDLIVFDEEAALAQAVTERFVEAASEAVARAGRFDVALAGGSTPKATYALLAGSPYRERVRWTAVRFFFGDERCVPPDDPASNYGMARATLLDPLGIPPSNVFRMRGEADPAVAAAEYAQILVRELGLEPVLDLIMLGMGPDGHTASIFPGSSPVTDDTLLVNAPFVPKFGTYRITLTPRAINAALEVVIATAGAAKADAVAHALDGPYDPNTYPVQIVNPTHGRLIWMIDRAAAAKLRPA
jgi:6-phosphogluconolactonase